MSDAISAIVITGELVFPDVMVGMVEASTARGPSRPRRRALVVCGPGRTTPPLRTHCLRDLTMSVVFAQDRRVYSTPSMLSDIEYCAWRVLREHLPDDRNSLGAGVHIEHFAATPLGEQVSVAVRVEQADGRRVVFSAEVRDRAELVGRARHTRIVVDVARHFERPAGKRERLATS